MSNRTQKAAQDYQKKNQEDAAGLQEAPDDSMTEAQAAVVCFSLWQGMVADGEAPNPNRYKADFLDFYKDAEVGTNAPLYFMFAGFLGGLDFANRTQEGAAARQRSRRTSTRNN